MQFCIVVAKAAAAAAAAAAAISVERLYNSSRLDAWRHDVVRSVEYAAADDLNLNKEFARLGPISTLNAATQERRGPAAPQAEVAVQCGFMGASSRDLAERLSHAQQAAGCPIVVLTTIMNNYDKFGSTVPPEAVEAASCYFALVDRATCETQRVVDDCSPGGVEVSRVDPWRVGVVDACEWGFADLRRASRVGKMLGFRLFPHAGWFVSIDAREKLLRTPSQLVHDLLVVPEKAFVAMQHPRSTKISVYEEGGVVVRSKLASREQVEAQLARYRADGMPEDHAPRVHEMGFFAYNAKSLDMRVLMCAWFDEYMRGSVRDQVCWSYVVWKLQLEPRLHSVPFRRLAAYVQKGSHLRPRTQSVPLERESMLEMLAQSDVKVRSGVASVRILGPGLDAGYRPPPRRAKPPLPPPIVSVPGAESYPAFCGVAPEPCEAPRVRPAWAAKLIEELYDARPRATCFPAFVVEHLTTRHGVPKLVATKCWDLVCTVHAMRAHDTRLELFARFLDETYGRDDLEFFLYVRGVARKAPGLRWPAVVARIAHPQTPTYKALIDTLQAHPGPLDTPDFLKLVLDAYRERHLHAPPAAGPASDIRAHFADVLAHLPPLKAQQIAEEVAKQAPTPREHLDDLKPLVTLLASYAAL
ncbi:hypothetical protein CTAYLR_005539 [Chrysophaeum taylorii]|uniref:TOD1/MUCI70 glycosyltransferase-like domain-containing protein n=1 Tax=Chrysophaeum taylorii TaxID=2483200 RepID=A0AAD7U5D6_9STRA|nr:hypothetical protein CTAYLR_005539 [Chrysophaeum taylorii]